MWNTINRCRVRDYNFWLKLPVLAGNDMQLKQFPLEDKYPFILHGYYHGYWWPGDARSRGIISYIQKIARTVDLQQTSWWRHQIEPFPCYWHFVRGVHLSPVNSTHRDQWRGALMFSLIHVWKDDWVHNQDAGNLRRHSAHHDVTVMY